MLARDVPEMGTFRFSHLDDLFDKTVYRKICMVGDNVLAHTAYKLIKGRWENYDSYHLSCYIVGSCDVVCVTENISFEEKR